MDRPFLNRPYLAIAFLVLISLYLFFFRLGSFALTDPDETFYAQTAKEMAARGEWLTPYLYGKPQFEKPILFYWLVEASYKIFGVNEFAARLPSAVFGLIGVIATYLLGTALFTRRVGLISAVISATSLEYIALSRACVTDMVLAVFFELAFLFFIYAYRSARPVHYIVSALFMALAVMTKGPIGILLPALIIALFLIMKKDLAAIKKMPVFLMAAVIAAITLPWYLFMYKAHGKAFMDVFFGYHNIVRFIEPEHKSGAVFYYYLPIIFGGIFPWSLFLPVAFWQSVKRSVKDKSVESSNHAFLMSWFMVFLVFFSVSSTKLPTYIFPAFAPLFIMIAVMWEGVLEAPGASAIRQMRFSQYLLFAGVLGMAIGASLFINRRYPEILGGAVIAGIVFTAGILFSLVSFIRGRRAASFVWIAAAVFAILIPISYLVIPGIERHETSKLVAEKLKHFMKPEDPIGCESNYLAGLAFYTGKFPANLDKHHDLVTFLNSPKRVWCVTKKKNHGHLYTLDTAPYYTRATYIVWGLGKKCVFTNLLPEDGKYLEKGERRK